MKRKEKKIKSPYGKTSPSMRTRRGRKIKGSRPGTPLTVDELEKRTFTEYANRRGSVVLDRSKQKDRLSQEMLETKMTLLPFVDDLEYIQLQVQSRIESHRKRLSDLEAESRQCCFGIRKLNF